MRISPTRLVAALIIVLSPLFAEVAAAQPIGVFRWQSQPFCNIITLAVTQNGSIFTLDGTDNLCGATQAASIVGTAFSNPDGSIGLGLNTVNSPGGQPTTISVRLSLPSASGTWTDSYGNAGNFTLTPAGPGTGGSPRPLLQRARPGQLLTGQMTQRYPANSGFFLAGDTYFNPLPTGTPRPTLNFRPNGTPDATCTGIGQVAVAGTLCVYGYNTQNVGSVVHSGASTGENRLFGFSLDIFPTDATNPGFFLASWAYRVP